MKPKERNKTFVRTVNQREILRELLRRDPRCDTLTHLILELYGYSPREQDQSAEAIAAQIQTLRAALSQSYGLDIDEKPLPTAEALERVKEVIIDHLESGDPWL